MFVENSTNNLLRWAKREGAKNDKLAKTTSTWHYQFSPLRWSGFATEPASSAKLIRAHFYPAKLTFEL